MTERKRRVGTWAALAGLVGALAVVAAGCGGDDGRSAGPSPTADPSGRASSSPSGEAEPSGVPAISTPRLDSIAVLADELEAV